MHRHRQPAAVRAVALVLIVAAILSNAGGLAPLGSAQAQSCAGLSAIGTPYAQDFDTLANTGTSSVLPSGWFFVETGTNNNLTYTAGTGSGNSGDTYSFGAAASTDRAFGGLLSGSLTPTIGACFTNNTGVTVSSLDIAYTGEQWRFGTTGRADRLDFQYSLNATSVTTGTWTDVDLLDFSSPNVLAAVGALDGNAAANRAAIASTVSELAIPAGATVWVRWTDFNAASSDDGLAVDDFSMTPQGGTPTNTPVPTETATPAATATGTPPTATPTNTATPTATPPTITTRIRDIQGAAHLSPLTGQLVANVPGVVTAKRGNGFNYQDPSPDANDATSEGIFVFTVSPPTVNVGDSVLVSGTVSEFRPGGSATNLTTTEIVSPVVSVVSTGNLLPPATILGIGGRAIPNQIINNDGTGNVEASGSFDVATDGIDFYESLEGMLVQINDAVAVGPTNSFGEIFVLADNGANASSRSAHGGVIVTPSDFNPERIQIDDTIVSGPPSINVGDRFNSPIIGVVDYNFSNFEVLNTQALPSVTSAGLTREVTSLTAAADKLTIGNFNVENLDPIDVPSDPTDGPAKFTALADRIVNNLRSPDILTLEEVQDNNGATNDSVVDASVTLNTLIAAISAAGGPTYQFQQINPLDDTNGGEPGGNIRVAFLYNPARVTFVERPGGSATAATEVVNNVGTPQVSFSPGLIDPTNAAFNASRKPLVGEFTFNGQTVFVIANHFNSKGGDEPLFGPAQPPTLTSEVQRQQQATIVRNFVQSILAVNANAKVVVAGDLNDFAFSNPVVTLKSAPLTALIETLPANEQYSYVFEGNSQALDHILASASLVSALDGFDILHINAEFADQISDHDPSVARFTIAQAATPTPTSTPTNTPAPTETPTPTNTPTNTPAPTDTPTPTNTPAPTETPTPTNTPVPPTATPSNTPTNTPVPPTATPSNTPTNTPVPPTATPSNTPTSTPVPPTFTPTPAPAGAIELRLEHGPQQNRVLSYDPPGTPAVLTQQLLGEPGCARFAAQPALMTVTAVDGNDIPRDICVLNLRMGVEKGPRRGPLDNYRVNVGEQVTFALGTHPSVVGKKISTAEIRVEGNQQTAIRVTAYDGVTVVGTQVVALSSLTPQGPQLQANNYTVGVNFGQGFTRLEVEAVTGSFSIVGGVNNSDETRFNLTN